MSLRLEPLADQRLDGFDSGNAHLDRWLSQSAHPSTGQGTRTWVVTTEHGAVAGYFAVAPHVVRRDHVPKSIGRGAPAEIPAVLLAKLALDRSLHGQGIGSELLLLALRVITEAARQVGGRLVVVDAIDDAAVAFYTHHDFRPIPDDDRRLVIKLSTVARVLGVTWP